MTNEKKNHTNFTTDWEKMYDFWGLTKDEFLKSYPHLTEEEYNLTCDETIGCRICGHEIPMRVTRDDFKEAIRVQLHNFKAKYNHQSAEYVYNEAYTIAKHEEIADFFINSTELDKYYQKLVPYLDNLLEDFCDYEWNFGAWWTSWDEMIDLVKKYIKAKEIEKNNYKEEN